MECNASQDDKGFKCSHFCCQRKIRLNEWMLWAFGLRHPIWRLIKPPSNWDEHKSCSLSGYPTLEGNYTSCCEKDSGSCAKDQWELRWDVETKRS
jgi:hypothetical protein